MEIYPYSHFERQIVDDFHVNFSNAKNNVNVVFYSRLEFSPVRVIVIDTARSKISDNKDKDLSVIRQFYQIWQDLNSSSGNELLFPAEYKRFLEFSDQVDLKSLDERKYLGTRVVKSKLWRIRKGENQSDFILLVNNAESYEILIGYLYQVSCYYQLAMDHIILHASGVIHKKGLFIFTGTSGAGKTTAAGFAQEMGAELLDDDQILLHKGHDGLFYGDGWGYQIKKGYTPIRGIFYLIQSDHDRLISLPKVQTARMLLDRFFEVVSPQLSADFQYRVFAQIASLTRTVPSYELRFRKSPDFWKLIDERFPD